MGGPLAYGLLILVVVVVVAVFLYGGLLSKSASAGEVDPEAPVEAGRHVRYEVPLGQDPAVVMEALVEAGYDVAPDTDTPRNVVTIRLPDTTARERERVREIVAEARATNLGGPPVVDTTPVRFLDEDPGPQSPRS